MLVRKKAPSKRLVVKRVKEVVYIGLLVATLLASTRVVKKMTYSYIRRSAAIEAAYPYSDRLGKDIDDFFYLDSTGATTSDKRNFCLKCLSDYTGKDDGLSKAGVKHFTRLYISTFIN